MTLAPAMALRRPTALVLLLAAGSRPRVRPHGGWESVAVWARARGEAKAAPKVASQVAEATADTHERVLTAVPSESDITASVAATSSRAARHPVDTSKASIARWEARFVELRAYARKHGHCRVPARFAPNPPLGRWVRHQRALAKEGSLDEGRAARLDTLGFDWGTQQVQRRSSAGPSWDDHFEELAAFHAQHGHCAVPRSMASLSAWASAQRKAARAGELPTPRARQLDELGFDWEASLVYVSREERWREQYGRLRAYSAQHGNCEVPQRYPPDPSLGTWVHTQRRTMADGRMLPERRAMLEEIGFSVAAAPPSARRTAAAEDADWEANLAQLQELLACRREAEDSSSSSSGGGTYAEACSVEAEPKVEAWLAKQAAARRAGRLSAKRAARLRAAGVALPAAELASSPAAAWPTRLAQLERFQRLHGHCDVPQHYAKVPGLGRWVGEQRAAYWAGRLTEARTEKLAALGFQFSGDASSEARWAARRDQLAVWMAAAPSLEEEASDPERRPALQLQLLMVEQPHLGAWLLRQRHLAAAKLLPPERAAALAALGRGVMDGGDGVAPKGAIERLWERRFAELKAHLAAAAPDAAPAAVEASMPPPLARWLAAQRRFHQLGALAVERLRRLQALPGFPGWSEPQPASAWESRYAELTAFWRAHGHCRVPQDGSALGRWVKAQRRAHRTGALSAAAARALDALGFHWGSRPQEEDGSWEAHRAALATALGGGVRSRAAAARWRTTLAGNPKLLRWAEAQAHEARMGRLGEHRAQALRVLCPNVLGEGEGEPAAPCLYAGRWAVALRRVELFAAAHGHAAVPPDYAGDPELGRWAEGVRAEAAAGRLSGPKQSSLDALRFEWSSDAAAAAVAAPAPAPTGGARHSGAPAGRPSDKPPVGKEGAQGERGPALRFTSAVSAAAWEARFAELVAFRAAAGHCCVPRGAGLLGNWVAMQRALAAGDALPSEHAARLSDIGFEWDAAEAEAMTRPSAAAKEWAARVAQLAAWGGPGSLLGATDPEFAAWAETVREARAAGRLAAASVAELDRLDFAWERRKEIAARRFLSNTAALRAHKATAGHLHDLHWAAHGRLAVWAVIQRRAAKEGRLPPAHAAALTRAGLDLSSSWEGRLAQLTAFLRSAGDCAVPRDTADPDLAALADWADEQRALKARRQLPEEKVARLDALGFPWRG